MTKLSDDNPDSIINLKSENFPDDQSPNLQGQLQYWHPSEYLEFSSKKWSSIRNTDGPRHRPEVGGPDSSFSSLSGRHRKAFFLNIRTESGHGTESRQTDAGQDFSRKILTKTRPGQDTDSAVRRHLAQTRTQTRRNQHTCEAENLFSQNKSNWSWM